MTSEERTIWLAALLHDIGKCFQRGDYGPIAVKGPHPMVGAEFVSAWREQFAGCTDLELLKSLVQRHHENPSIALGLQVEGLDDDHTRALARLVSRADNLVSSERGEAAGDFQDFRRTALAPVSLRVALLEQETPDDWHLPQGDLGSLRHEPPIFPESGLDIEPSHVTAHVRAFGDALEQLRTLVDWTSFDCVYSHLYALLQRFTANIASDTQSARPDISLFDHLRLTSAVAACLYRYHSKAGTLDDAKLKRKTPDAERCLLLVGDLSGMQDYLFAISTTGASGVARRLRARSFMLQMLSEVACLRLLRLLDLPPANVVMSSGGKFYLLLPNLAEVEQRVTEFQRECDAWLMKRYHGALALNVAWTTVADREFGTEGGGFGVALARLHRNLAERKARRLEGGLMDEEGWLAGGGPDAFVRQPFGRDQSVCASCRRFPAVGKMRDDDADDEQVCDRCLADNRLGSALTRGEYVCFYENETVGHVPCLGWSFAVTASPRDDAAFVARLNDGDCTPAPRRPCSYRLLANYVPQHGDGRLKEFDDLAGGGLLAVIKADVDHLGQVFQEGLRRDLGGEHDRSYDTPSRVAALSRQLDLFFSGWLEWLLRTEFPDTYTIFSGGDDLLLVGPRAQALSLVSRINDAFRDYTRNPEMTLSAGIALVKPRLPIAHTAEFAEAALEAAKEGLSGTGDGRNRLCVLKTLVRWEDLPLVQEAVGLLNRAQPPASFLYRLLWMGGLWRRWREKRDTLGLSFQPLLAYTVGRNLDPRHHGELVRWAQRLVALPLTEEETVESRTMDYLPVIAQWAILDRREK